MANKKFECWKCGACCRFVGFVDPSLDRGDRACIHLQDDMSCGIYETRPDMCRLDPEMPVDLQTRWCNHQEKHWRIQVEEQEILRDIAIERG